MGEVAGGRSQPCACRSPPTTRSASSPASSTPWSRACASASASARPSAAMSTRASPPPSCARQGEGVLAGEIGEATILFTDIAGFTTIAEYLAPDRAGGGAERVSRDRAGADPRPWRRGQHLHRRRPVRLVQHAARLRRAMPAPRCGPRSTSSAPSAAAPSATMGVALATRIGISTGHVIGGSVGAGQRMSFTLLGDTVNLAARLEAVEQGARHAHSRLAEHARGLRRAASSSTALGSVAVRGRSDAVAVFSVDPNGQETSFMNASGSVARPGEAAGPRPRAGGRARRQARRRGRSHRAVSLGQCRAAEGRQADRHDHPAAVWRPGQGLARRRAGHRGAVGGLRRHRPHRRRDQHGRDQRGDGLRLGRAEEDGGRHGAGGRQARHLHHRARGGLGRQRHDHARRQEGQPLRRQRPQALDHRRRRLAPAPDLRQGLSTRRATRKASAASSPSATRPRG